MRRQKTQVKSHNLDVTSPWVFISFTYIFYINLKFYFLDSTPVNGASEQITDDMETKPKSPAQEESNENTASSPTR